MPDTEQPLSKHERELLPSDEPETDSEKTAAIMAEVNELNRNDPTRFIERSFAVIWNEGHSVRLISRENPRWAISIPWDEIDALRAIFSGTRPSDEILVRSQPCQACGGAPTPDGHTNWCGRAQSITKRKRDNQAAVEKLAEDLTNEIYYHATNSRSRLRELLIQFAEEIKRQAIEP